MEWRSRWELVWTDVKSMTQASLVSPVQQLILFCRNLQVSEPCKGPDLSLSAFKFSVEASTEPFLGAGVEREEEQGQQRPWWPEVTHSLLRRSVPRTHLM